MSDLNLFIPMTKVDIQTRQVWGRATQEVLDGGKEIFDYESSLPFFRRWSEAVQKRSQGKSKGNLRAMHQPIAAGKIISIDFNEAEKAIDIGTYISDDKEWQKVLDGTYTGFSVGGKYAKRWPDMTIMGATRYTADPHEISLVDAPAVPTATFQLVKADGSIEVRKFDNIRIPGEETVAQPPIPGMDGDEILIEQSPTEGSVPPDEPALVEIESDAVITAVDPADPGSVAAAALETSTNPEGGDPATVKDTPPEWVGKFQEAAEKISASIDQLIDLRKQNAEREEKVIAELKLRGERVGIARREGSPVAPPQGYPSAWQSYADPANYAFPMEKALAAEQIAHYNLGKGREFYTPREWMVLGRRIARLASDAFGGNYKFSTTETRVERQPMEKQTMTDLNKTNVDGLLRDVQSQLTEAARLIGTDPAAAMNLLTRAQAAIDVASNVRPASPAAPAAPVAKAEGATAPTGEKCAKCEAELSKDATFCSKCGTKVEKIAAPEDPILKMLAEQQKALQALGEQVSKLAAAPANPFAQLPIGDLNSIVDQQVPNANDDPVAKALLAGDLQKAFEAVGPANPSLLYERVNDIAVKQIFDQGINVARYGIFNLPTPDA